MTVRKKLGVKKKVKRRLLKTDAQRKNMYIRIIDNELKPMSLHKLFLTRMAIGKIARQST